jgi:hypothetical protein
MLSARQCRHQRGGTIRLRRHRLQVGQPLTPVVDFKEPATAPLAFIMNPCLIATLPFDKT